ncbi:MAG: hypothetical protein FJY81_06185, partial [Candidatus Aminicenantes bacterium]|nr:hypothetical protein [Candidatus Aminicenantes bacterium]
MTAFGILSIVAGLGLAAFLTCRRFSAGRAEKNAPLISRAAGYFAWLGRVLSGFFKRQGWLSVRSFYVAWLSRY